MMRFALGLVLLLALPATARASTPIGDVTTPAGTTLSSTGYYYVQAQGGGGKGYAAPSDGVLTGVDAVATGSSITARVFAARPSGGSSYTVVGGGDIPLTASAPTAFTPARIPVKKDDVLGVYYPNGSSFGAYGVSGATIAAEMRTTPPADGSTVTPPSPITAVNLLIAATFEPDADGDGYGDETQDSCPSLPTIHSGPCTTDLRVTASTKPATVEQGQLTSVVATVTNAGMATAFATTAALTIPDSLEVVAASSSDADCSGTSCSVGDIPPGASRRVFLVLRPKTAGSAAVTVSAASSTPESAPADNTSSAALDVTAPASPTPAPTVKLCTVPKLKGKTKAKAKASLTQAGCKAGTVHGKKGKVRAQTIPAGVKVVAGTKVGFRIRK